MEDGHGNLLFFPNREEHLLFYLFIFAFLNECILDFVCPEWEPVALVQEIAVGISTFSE